MRMTLDPMLFVSVGRGRIKDLNDPAAALLGTDRESLIGAPFGEEFRDRRQDEFIEGLVTTALSETSSGVEVSARRSRKKIDIVPRILRAAGERILICRIFSYFWLRCGRRVSGTVSLSVPAAPVQSGLSRGEPKDGQDRARLRRTSEQRIGLLPEVCWRGGSSG